jgi:hypothetical protein
MDVRENKLFHLTPISTRNLSPWSPWSCWNPHKDLLPHIGPISSCKISNSIKMKNLKKITLTFLIHQPYPNWFHSMKESLNKICVIFLLNVPFKLDMCVFLFFPWLSNMFNFIVRGTMFNLISLLWSFFL